MEMYKKFKVGEVAEVAGEGEKPKPIVRLIGEDGNAFTIIGRVVRALRKAGYSEEEVREYRKDATSGDYDNLLRVTMEWVNEGDEEDWD